MEKEDRQFFIDYMDTKFEAQSLRIDSRLQEVVSAQELRNQRTELKLEKLSRVDYRVVMLLGAILGAIGTVVASLGQFMGIFDFKGTK